MATQPEQIVEEGRQHQVHPAGRKNVPGLILRLVLACAGVPLCIWAVQEQVTSAYTGHAIRSSQPKTRSAGLTQAANRRDGRVLEDVLKVLGREQDRALLEKAAYAAARIGQLRALPLLKRRADDGPDDQTKAKMILYVARLSERDPRLSGWLTAGAQSAQPWRQAGALLGLVELGKPIGGRMLMAALPKLDPEIRGFALDEFRNRVGSALLETAGVGMNWEDLDSAPAADPRWKLLTDFWNERVSSQLLNDVLDRQDRRDPDWFLVGRLLHARDQFKRLLF